MIDKISQLRALFKKNNIDGYIIPSNDEYQNEYPPESSKRLRYISGFTGSNGIAIITKDKVYFWTDARYTIQAKKEVNRFISSSRDFTEVGSASIGYNPMLFTKSQISALSKQLTLIPIHNDFVDQIWSNRASNSHSMAYLYPTKYAGMDAEAKLKLVRQNFINKAQYALITEPDSICWLLNIRGEEIEAVPVILGFLILSQSEIIVFTDLAVIGNELQNALPFVTFKSREEIFDALKTITDSVLVDLVSCSVALLDLIKNKIDGINPCIMQKACKNKVEIEYAKKGHVKDAIALCEGLTWITQNRGITEYEVSLKLTELRSKQDGYVMNSFDTIAGFRENGASMHYKPQLKGSKIIEGNGILLIDSGGHYCGCTTDVTRVLVFGTPTDEQKKRYTQVLKGHIALGSAIVPEGTYGGSLDICARQYLWQDGVDYAHGTGHGVGSMLNVHEYPRYIWSQRALTELKEGMTISNEPGFYKEGEFGIRIENVMYVKKSQHVKFLEFEMLTLVPYSRDLIDLEMLTKSEKEFLKRYYSRIKELVLPSLSHNARTWCEYEMGLELL